MASPPEDQLLGRIALHYKLVTQEQLNQALQRQTVSRPPKKLGDVLLELKIITPEQLQWLIDAASKVAAKQGGPTPSAPTAIPSPSASAPTPLASSPRPPPAPAASAPQPAAPPSQPAPAPKPAGLSVTPGPPQLESVTMDSILKKAVALKASDIHIHSGAAVQLRLSGVLKDMKTATLNAAAAKALIDSVLTPEQRTQLEQHHDLDFALNLPVGRFRASVYRQQRGYDAVLRPIPPKPPSLEELGLPKTLERLTGFHQGLVLLTGPAGCGKSSTMAALVDMVNQSRHDHIITVEDPIEYVHTSKGCVVNQRQAGRHTKSFANALRAALREDPDVIVIGELRDLETISLAITAAETGHLVMGTLHTNNAIRTINRILDAFPPAQQSQIRAMVSESLRAIVSQRLVPTTDGSRRVVALETLFVKPAVSNLIRDEKTFQIRSIMQTGRTDGMCLLDDSLADLVKAGTISKDTARRAAEDPKRFV